MVGDCLTDNISTVLLVSETVGNEKRPKQDLYFSWYLFYLLAVTFVTLAHASRRGSRNLTSQCRVFSMRVMHVPAVVP